MIEFMENTSQPFISAGLVYNRGREARVARMELAESGG